MLKSLNSRTRINFFLLLIIFQSKIYADNNFSFKTYLSNINNQTFWLSKNTNGIDLSKNTLNLFFNDGSKKFSYQMDLYFQNNSRLVGESYIKFKLKNSAFIRAGQYYRDFSNYLNDEISLGHMLVSKNALPIKKIGYVSKFTKNENLNFQYGITHGILDQNSLYSKSPFLHEKFITLNYTKKNQSFMIGFVHEAIWAGNVSNYGNQPSSIKDFFKVFIAADEPIREGQDHANALGNHLGIWDFVYQYNSKNYTTKFYHQHFFEDTSGLRFANGIDGLWGFEILDINSQNNFLLEYLHTTNQDSNPPYVNDAYYNHAIYRAGWSYKDNTIGNPYINSSLVIPVNVINYGFQTHFNDFKIDVKSSRITNSSKEWNYMIGIKKDISIFSLGLVIANNSNKESFLITFEL